LICYLYANAGRIISRDELLSKVWKCQQTMTIRTGDQTISSLRRKLGDHAESPRYLITVNGVGYTLPKEMPFIGILPPWIPKTESAVY